MSYVNDYNNNKNGLLQSTILIQNKMKLIKELTNRGYFEDQIRLRVEQSRCI